MSARGVRRGLAAATVVVGTAMAVSRVLGFLRNSVLAALFGQNNITDAYNTAFLVPDTLYLILVGGGISSAFIPVLSRYLAEGDEAEVWRVASIAFNVVALGIAVVIAVGVVAAPLYVKLLAPWFPPAKYRLTVALTRVTVLTILFHALNGVLIGAEYAYNSYTAASLGPLVYNVTVIAVGVALAPRLGIFAFAWSTLIGAGLNFLVQLYGTLRLRPRYTPSLDLGHPGLRRVARLMFPVAVGLSIAQLNLLFNQSFLASSLAPGTINALVLASRVMLVPVLVATSIGITLLPNLTRHAACGDTLAFRHAFSTSMRAVLFVSLPAAVGLMILAAPIVRILFQHGNFGPRDTAVTAAALAFYSVGIVAYGLYEILSRAFYALEDTSTPLRTGVASIAAGFLLNVLLIHLWSYRGLALAYSLTGFVNAFLLLRALHRRVGRLDLRRIVDSGLRTLFASLFMGALTYAFVAWLEPRLALPTGLGGDALRAFLPILVGVATFLAGARAAGSPELGLVLRLVHGRIRHTV